MQRLHAAAQALDQGNLVRGPTLRGCCKAGTVEGSCLPAWTDVLLYVSAHTFVGSLHSLHWLHSLQ